MFENYDQTIVFYFFDIPINTTIMSTWIVNFLLVILSWLAIRKLSTDIHISKWQTFMEMIVLWLKSEFKETSSDNPLKYMGLGMALFMFIIVSNLLTIFPWFKPATASLSTTFAFAFIVFLAIPYFSIKNGGVKKYLNKFITPSLIMFPMNIFSEFSTTFAMALRLYGNMLSGVMFGAILTSFLPFLLPLPTQILGLLTGSIQAYIFALLAVIYASSIEPETPYIEEEKTYY